MEICGCSAAFVRLFGEMPAVWNVPRKGSPPRPAGPVAKFPFDVCRRLLQWRASCASSGLSSKGSESVLYLLRPKVQRFVLITSIDQRGAIMKLRRVVIKNFRKLSDIDFSISKNLSVVVGPMRRGKALSSRRFVSLKRFYFLACMMNCAT